MTQPSISPPPRPPAPVSTVTAPTDTYWSVPADQLLAALDSSPQGLTSADAQQRLKTVGPNALEVSRRTTALGLFLRQFKNPLVLILIFAATVSAAVQEWTDAAVILAIVVGSAAITFYQEYRAGNAVAELQSRLTRKATTLRDGTPQAIPVEQLVPGDVVLLSAGSLIPA
ncbi:MAG: magnesium-translocating P-type ATPase, partial [Anaerolineae bacterium]|nr:magnesium-translocating P-type ATPase [Anaerolineae bacterium]